MKNIEVVNNLKSLVRFISREVELNKALVSTVAKFKMKKNLKTLQDIDKPYEEVLKEIMGKYNLRTDENGQIIADKDNQNIETAMNEIQALMQAENDVKLEMISEKDIVEDCLLGDELLLEFMTEEVEEDECKNV